MTGYRIKHLETGLYYRPCIGVGKRKTNLGINGKVYLSKPTERHCVFEDDYLINVSESQLKKFPYFQNIVEYSYGTYYIKSIEQQWEIEEL